MPNKPKERMITFRITELQEQLLDRARTAGGTPAPSRGAYAKGALLGDLPAIAGPAADLGAWHRAPDAGNVAAVREAVDRRLTEWGWTTDPGSVASELASAITMDVLALWPPPAAELRTSPDPDQVVAVRQLLQDRLVAGHAGPGTPGVDELAALAAEIVALFPLPPIEAPPNGPDRDPWLYQQFLELIRERWTADVAEDLARGDVDQWRQVTADLAGALATVVPTDSGGWADVAQAMRRGADLDRVPLPAEVDHLIEVADQLIAEHLPYADEHRSPALATDVVHVVLAELGQLPAEPEQPEPGRVVATLPDPPPNLLPHDAILDALTRLAEREPDMAGVIESVRAGRTRAWINDRGDIELAPAGPSADPGDHLALAGGPVPAPVPNPPRRSRVPGRSPDADRKPAAGTTTVPHGAIVPRSAGTDLCPKCGALTRYVKPGQRACTLCEWKGLS